MLGKHILKIASIVILGLSVGFASTAHARTRHRHYHHHYRHYHRHHRYAHYRRHHYTRRNVNFHYRHRTTVAISAGGGIQVEPHEFRIPGFDIPVFNTQVPSTRFEVPGLHVYGNYSLAFHGVNPLTIAKRTLGHGRFRGMPYEWCRAYVNRVLRRGGYFTTSSNLAIEALNIGPHVSARNLRKGDLVVMHGHITFFAGYDRDGYIIGLGGNQGGHRGHRRVQYSRYSPSRVVAYVHPVLASRYRAIYRKRYYHHHTRYAMYGHRHHWHHWRHRTAHRHVYYSSYPARRTHNGRKHAA